MKIRNKWIIRLSVVCRQYLSIRTDAHVSYVVYLQNECSFIAEYAAAGEKDFQFVVELIDFFSDVTYFLPRAFILMHCFFLSFRFLRLPSSFFQTGDSEPPHDCPGISSLFGEDLFAFAPCSRRVVQQWWYRVRNCSHVRFPFVSTANAVCVCVHVGLCVSSAGLQSKRALPISIMFQYALTLMELKPVHHTATTTDGCSFRSSSETLGWDEHPEKEILFFDHQDLPFSRPQQWSWTCRVQMSADVNAQLSVPDHDSHEYMCDSCSAAYSPTWSKAQCSIFCRNGSANV